MTLAGRETVDAVLQVYSFLRRLGTQISPFALGGPKTIAEAAGGAAYEGVSQLLIFLTLLSANLAVVNFLPIPLLDGGHMVFLILEGLMRRPVSETSHRRVPLPRFRVHYQPDGVRAGPRLRPDLSIRRGLG